jgi:hypothetical protein
MKLVGDMLRLFLPVAAVAVLLTLPAAAQFPMPSVSLSPDQKKLTPEELERQKAIDKAYRAATSKIPEKKVDDPWADVRPPTGSGAKKKQQ